MRYWPEEYSSVPTRRGHAGERCFFSFAGGDVAFRYLTGPYGVQPYCADTVSTRAVPYPSQYTAVPTVCSCDRCCSGVWVGPTVCTVGKLAVAGLTDGTVNLTSFLWRCDTPPKATSGMYVRERCDYLGLSSARLAVYYRLFGDIATEGCVHRVVLIFAPCECRAFSVCLSERLVS